MKLRIWIRTPERSWVRENRELENFFLEDAGIFEYAKQESHGPPGMNMGGDLIPFFSRCIGLEE